MSVIVRLLLVVCLTLGSAVSVAAHEVRPAYLELREEQPREFAVLWKVPARGDMRLSLEPSFSGETRASQPVARTAAGALLETWTLHAPALRGQTLTIAGLESTMTDVLARIEFADGSTWTQRLSAANPSAVIPERQSAFAVASVYLKLGMEHILLGIDHLLFVLALLIITKGPWRLVKTVTAFTVAHSITLALATLGFVHVPQAPVEAVIALSIVFVATEIVRTREGGESFTARAPWIVAFAFGLLHGFGFAGALSDIGLPEGQIPLALLFFNLGVEMGQLLFIAAVLACLAVLRRVRPAWPRWAEFVPPYAIGTIATFWVIERIAAF
jgi:hydrogenase/urease accessory protein HupE